MQYWTGAGETEYQLTHIAVLCIFHAVVSPGAAAYTRSTPPSYEPSRQSDMHDELAVVEINW